MGSRVNARIVVVGLALLLALAALALAAKGPADTARAQTSSGTPGGLQATIRTTSHGIPHIVASDFPGLGFGYGYAAAKENICVLADTYVTVNAERSRWFGPDAQLLAGRQRHHQQQPQQRLLLPEDQGQRLDRAAARARSAARAAARDQGGRARLRRRLQQVACARPASTTSPTRAARAPGGCARSPRWTPTAASTSSA